MKPFYCADSQDRIPVEFFKQGKAVWSGGRPYLRENAMRLGLKLDARPPVEYAEALGFPVAVPNAPAAQKPPVLPAAPNIPKPVVSTVPAVQKPSAVNVAPIVQRPLAPNSPPVQKAPAPINIAPPQRINIAPIPPQRPIVQERIQPPAAKVPPPPPDDTGASTERGIVLPISFPNPSVPARPPAPPVSLMGPLTAGMLEGGPGPTLIPAGAKKIDVADAAPKKAEPPAPVQAKQDAPAIPPKPDVAPVNKNAVPVPDRVFPRDPNTARTVPDFEPLSPADIAKARAVSAALEATQPEIVAAPAPAPVPAPVAAAAPKPVVPAPSPGKAPAQNVAVTPAAPRIVAVIEPPAPTPAPPPASVPRQGIPVPSDKIPPRNIAVELTIPEVPDVPKDAAKTPGPIESVLPTIMQAPKPAMPVPSPVKPPPRNIAVELTIPEVPPSPPAKAPDAAPKAAAPIAGPIESVLPTIMQAPKPAGPVPGAIKAQLRNIAMELTIPEPPPVPATEKRPDAAKAPAAVPPAAKAPVAAAPVPARGPIPLKPPAVDAAAKPPPSAAKPAAPISAAKPAAPAAPTEEEEMEISIPLQPGEPLSFEEMKRLEILEGVPDGKIKLLYGGIVRREFKKGELICKQGEYASTAFYILSGTAEVYIRTPDKIALEPLKKQQRKLEGGTLWQRIKFWAERRKEGPRKSRSRQRPIPIDAPEDLPADTKMIELRAGDLFGEMSCINFYPRSANVRAKDDCVMLEIIRTVIDAIRDKKGKGKYKEKLDANYRKRSLDQHLNSIPLFKDLLDREFINQLRNRVELQDYTKGEVIFKQGDKPDAFYLIRRGCVKITQKHPGGEIVLTYLGQNDSFGEIGLLRGVNRTATCTAMDNVELVRIRKEHFDFLTQCYDEFKVRMEREADERLSMARSVAARPPAKPLDEFIDHELMQAQNMLILDLERCTRCDECVKACVDSHDDGITRLVREGLRFDKYLVATSCRSCLDPVCMVGCPVGSIRREETFEIIIEDWCIGCEKCAKQCPYGNITMHDFPKEKEDLERDIKDEMESQRKKAAAAALKPPAAKAPASPHAPAPDPIPTDEASLRKAAVLKVAAVDPKAVTCDQCSTLQEPSCVYACPHEAAIRVNARDFFEVGGKSGLKDKTKSVKKA